MKAKVPASLETVDTATAAVTSAAADVIFKTAANATAIQNSTAAKTSDTNAKLAVVTAKTLLKKTAAAETLATTNAAKLFTL